jgi:hypothetical protein
MFYIVANCPVCLYGSIGFWRCEDGKTIILLCDECDSLWLGPQKINTESLLASTARDNFIPEVNCFLTGGQAGPATKEDIKKQGWLNYIKDQYGDKGEESKAVEKSDNPFTILEYKEFVQRCVALEVKASVNFHYVLEQERKLHEEYRSRLPVYLLARCPICGGRVHERIDTYSLNGPGWKAPGGRGFGWYGTIPQSAVSYEAECRHVVIVSVMTNLNGIQPNDVNQEVWITSERPFVMSPVLNLEQTYAVIHSLPVGRFDDFEPQHHYTAYFVTYFTNVDRRIYDKVMQPAHEGYGLVVIDWANYDLLRWVKKGKLYWLDKNDSDLPLRNGPVSDFPYGNVKGGEGIWVIRNGRMQPYYSLKPMRWSGGEWQPEPGFFQRLAKSFRPRK